MASKNSMTALEFLQRELAETVDHTDADETKEVCTIFVTRSLRF